MMITAVVMVSGLGEEPDEWGSEAIGVDPVQWVRGARRAATADLLQQLSAQPRIERLILVTPEPGGLDIDGGVETILSDPGPIHVGRFLANLVKTEKIEKLLYFGGGSAPLLTDDMLSSLIERLSSSERLVLANNRFASDWAAVRPAGILAEWVERLPQDNMLGWVLSTEAGLPVEDFPATAASRLDIDTPVDLITLAVHSGTKLKLRRFLDSLPLDKQPLEGLLRVLAKPAGHLFISGRLGPAPWQALNNATQCWIRVFSEERGMVSSGRQAKGEVYSFLADYLAGIGPEVFFEKLSGQVEAALIDSRVLLAHHRLWPEETDRFASDLGLTELIKDPWLRDFTAAAKTATIPILLGGHSLLSGDLLAFCEML